MLLDPVHHICMYENGAKTEVPGLAAQDHKGADGKTGKRKLTSLPVMMPVTLQQSKLQTVNDNSKRSVNKVKRNEIKQVCKPKI